MYIEDTGNPAKFRLTITPSTPNYGEFPDCAPAYGSLGKRVVQEFSEHLRKLPAERLSQIVLFELPYLDKTEDGEAILEASKELLSGRDWSLCRFPDRTRLIDTKTMKQWRKTYSYFFGSDGYYQHNRRDVSFPDFIRVVMDQAEGVSITDDSFSQLVYLAERGNNNPLFKRLADYALGATKSSDQFTESDKPSLGPEVFSLVSTYPNPVPLPLEGSNDNRDLLDVIVRAFSQQVAQLPAKRLSNIKVFEFPPLKNQEDREALCQLVREAAPKRQFRLDRGPDALRLIDSNLLVEWQRVYTPFFQQDGSYQHTQQVPFADFLRVVMNQAQGVKICNSNFAGLVDLAHRAQNTPMLKNLSEHVLDRFSRCSEIESKEVLELARNQLISEAGIVGKVYNQFLQDLWNYWEDLAKRFSENRDFKYLRKSGERRIERMTPAIRQVLKQLDGSSITVHFYDNDTIKPTLYWIQEKAPSTRLRFKIPSKTRSLPPTGDIKALTNVQHYDLNGTDLELHRPLLSMMPYLSSIDLYIRESWDADELDQALSKPTFIERCHVEIKNAQPPKVLQKLFRNLQRWPVEELSLRASPEQGKALLSILPQTLPRLNYLKKLSLSGIAFPLLRAPLSIEHFEIKKIPSTSASEMAKAEAALRQAAPNLLTVHIEEPQAVKIESPPAQTEDPELACCSGMIDRFKKTFH
jgi:hypothetical protein